MDTAAVPQDDALSQKLQSLVVDFTKLMAVMVSQEVRQTVGSGKAGVPLSKKIAPYIVAAGALAFSGKDLDRDSISKLVASIGVEVDDEVLDQTFSLKYKNHVVYLCALYFMIGCGEQDPTPEKMLPVLAAMDVHPDIKTCAYVLEFFKNARSQATQLK